MQSRDRQIIKTLLSSKYNMEEATDNFNRLLHFYALNNGNETKVNLFSQYCILVAIIASILLISFSFYEEDLDAIYYVYSTLGVGSVLVSTGTVFIKTKQTCVPYILVADLRSRTLEIREIKNKWFHYDMQNIDRQKMGSLLKNTKSSPVLLLVPLPHVTDVSCIVDKTEGRYGCLTISYKITDIQALGGEINDNDHDDSKNNEYEWIQNGLEYTTVVNEKPIKIACVYEAMNFIRLAVRRYQYAVIKPNQDIGTDNSNIGITAISNNNSNNELLLHQPNELRESDLTESLLAAETHFAIMEDEKNNSEIKRKHNNKTGNDKKNDSCKQPTLRAKAREFPNNSEDNKGIKAVAGTGLGAGVVASGTKIAQQDAKGKLKSKFQSKLHF